MRRIAGLWDVEAIAEVLGHDNRLREITSAELTDKATTGLEDLDDLGVLVLFSVFEATVRARTEADVDREIADLCHPAVLSAVKELKDAIRNGSFGKITAAYKKMDTDLRHRKTHTLFARRHRNVLVESVAATVKIRTQRAFVACRVTIGRKIGSVFIEMTPDQGLPGDSGDHVGFFDEPAQHAGTAFRSLVEENRLADSYDRMLFVLYVYIGVFGHASSVCGVAGGA
jgi:hypothetical protein